MIATFLPRSTLARLAALALVAACSMGDAPRAAGARSEALVPAAAPAALPPNLSDVMRQVHFAFRAEGDGWTGGHRTYEVRAGPSGFAVAPAATADQLRAVSPARFEATSFGQRPLEEGVGRLAPDGHLALARTDVVEHLRNGEEGVEQSFEIASRPRAGGDLEVRIRVTGETYAGETETGHHFADRATGLGVCYGKATWVDARGARVALAVAWTGEELVIKVPAALAAASPYPAVIDPTVSPEFGIDTPVTGGATADQTYPSVASDGTDWLVAWRDTRVSGTTMIVGTRVSGAGVVLDVGGLVLEPTIGSSSLVAAAFDGTNYLVVIADSASPRPIRGVRVTTAGAVLDGAPGVTVVSSVGYGLNGISVAYGGSRYLVTWDENYGYYVRGALVTSAGVAGATFNIATSATQEVIAPTVASDGTNFFVAWQDFRSGFYYDIYGSRVTSAGTVLDPTGIAISTAANDQKEPSIAFDGANYLIVWNDGKWGNPDIFGARVSPAGTVLDPSGIAIAMTAGAQTAPSVAFDGTHYVVAWADTRNGNSDVWAARVDKAANVLDPAGFPVSSGTAAEQAPRVACAGATCLASWQDQRTGTSWDVYGARVKAGVVSDPAGILLSSAANDEVAPALAFDGTNYLVVWQDRRSFSNWDIYGARVSAGGAVLDPSGIAISTAAGDQTAPRVAWMAPNYLVVWADKRGGVASDIWAARVDAAGTVKDAAGFAVSTATNDQLAPSVASDGTNYLVTWCDARSGSTRPYAARVGASGATLDAAGILLASYGCSATAVAFDGTRYLAVWSSGVYAVRLSTAGAVLDTTPIYLGGDNRPRAAFDGLNFVVVYEMSSGVFGGRVTGAGALLDPSGLPIAPYVTGSTKDMPDVACDGTTCFVVWRNAGKALSGGFIDQAGDILNPGGIALALSPTAYATPAVSTDGSGHWLVPYQHLDLYSPFGSQRVHARTVVSLGQGKPCTALSDCASNFCVDGFCCNTACGGGVTIDCFACSAALGATANGSCTALSGAACDDGNGCTAGDTCHAGTCAGTAVVCAPLDLCHTAGVCAPATGLCSNPAKVDGAACDDGSACTRTDTCVAGACVGKNPVVCPTADTCHTVAACDPATGTCAVAPKADGSACDDGNACTAVDLCTGGVCAGTSYSCATPDQCHQAGTCNGDGTCSYANKPNNTTCGDGDDCTRNDVCTNGVCAGTSYTCAAPDACHQAGTCNGNGTCSYANKADSTACDDGNACTRTDACQAGQCLGTNAVVCTTLDSCHTVGSCAPATGQCSNPVKSDGTPCPAGSCQGGLCVAGVDAGLAGMDAATTSGPDAMSTSGPDATTTGGPDASTSGRDAGTVSRSDAAVAPADAGSVAPTSGCGCASSGIGSPLTSLLGLGLLGMSRRRRSQPR